MNKQYEKAHFSIASMKSLNLNTIRTQGCGTAHNEHEHKAEEPIQMDLLRIELSYRNAKEHYFRCIQDSKPLDEIDRAEHNYIQMEDIYFKAKERLREKIREKC